jgi:hypothetical protein
MRGWTCMYHILILWLISVCIWIDDGLISFPLPTFLLIIWFITKLDDLVEYICHILSSTDIFLFLIKVNMWFLKILKEGEAVNKNHTCSFPTINHSLFRHSKTQKIYTNLEYFRALAITCISILMGFKLSD